MYLTAQKVESPNGIIGINSFYHSHKGIPLPKTLSTREIISVAESNTGTLIKDKCDVKPGGNKVKSYLDVVALDSIDEKSLVSALTKFQNELKGKEIGPIIEIIDKIGFCFTAELPLYDNLDDEFTLLKKRALSLFRLVKDK
jgi:hypothetical protein